MDPKQITEALDALIADDAPKCQEILKAILATAAGGADPDAMTEDAPPPVGDGGADENAEAALDPSKEEDKNAVAAATSRLTRITGKTTLVGAVDEVEVWRKSHVEFEFRKATLKAEQDAIDLAKRKENAVKLTALGAETPVTTGLGAKTPKLCKRLLDEPLEEQTARVAVMLAARGGKLPKTPEPPKGDSDLGLSDKELAMCSAKKIDPAKYAATRAGIRARSTNGTGV